MKTCKKCGIEKPEGEFYRKVDNKDGLDRWCKSCRISDTRRFGGSHSLAKSTEQAIKLLSENGIPVTTGLVAGRPGKDIVAYGYLTIEAKSTWVHGGKNGYKFGFTKTQRENPCDFYVLIFGDVGRVFVIPGNASIMEFNGEKLYLNLTDPRLLKYENAYRLIKERTKMDIDSNIPIRGVVVLFKGKAYPISC